MNKNIIKAYDELYLGACDENMFSKDIEYMTLEDKGSKIQKQIIEIIPVDLKEKFKKMLIELEDVEARISSIENQKFYERGINDGVQMLKKLKVI